MDRQSGYKKRLVVSSSTIRLPQEYANINCEKSQTLNSSKERQETEDRNVKL